MAKVVPYTGMPPRKWFPETPQLLKDVWMLIVRYRANRDALQAVLPPGLDPHPDSLVRMNMYVVPDGRQTSGFGPYSLTYLTVELAGHDSWVNEGAMAVPGTFFVYYWNSSERVRRYTREAAGIPALPGSCTWQREGDKLISTLTVDDQPVIRTVASVTDNLLMPLGGHLNYYSHRQFGAPEGGRAVVSELLEFSPALRHGPLRSDRPGDRLQLPGRRPRGGARPAAAPRGRRGAVRPGDVHLLDGAADPGLSSGGGRLKDHRCRLEVDAP